MVAISVDSASGGEKVNQCCLYVLLLFCFRHIFYNCVMVIVCLVFQYFGFVQIVC